MNQFEPCGLERLGHHIGGLLLRIFLTAVGDHGKVVEVADPARTVVDVPELFFIPGRSHGFVLEDLEEFRRFREAGAGPAATQRPG